MLPSSLIARFRPVVFAAGVLLSMAGSLSVAAQQLAFPGAEGAGRFTSGGRGTKAAPTTVFEVTNLNDDNKPGCLRYALTQPAEARTVVFRVSGTIHLTSDLNITKANTTIAGQTAPGDGICLADYPVTVKASNVIVRFMRFRMGDRYQNKGMVDGAGGDDAFGGGGMGRKRIIIDHCSMSWSTDEAFSFYNADSMTLQWNLVSEPLNYSYHFEEGDKDFERHGFGGIWGGHHASFHHNLFAHCNNRTPRFNGSRQAKENGWENCDFRNNVIYDWGGNNVYAGEGGNYNVVNNYYKAGPSTNEKVRFQILNPYKLPPTLPYGKFYLTGNHVEGAPYRSRHNWAAVAMQGGTPADTVLAKAETPFDLGPVHTQTATQAYDAVLAHVGCVMPSRDTLDQRILRDVRKGTGRLIDVQGGYPHGTSYTISQRAWPVLNSLPAPPDSDHDGMPDAWEKKHNLNPTDPVDRNTVGKDGYTMLEIYLNSLAGSVVK